MQGRSEAVKAALEEVVDSVRDFSDRIIEHADGYTLNEVELAHRLRLCVIFYKARERGEQFDLPTIGQLNEIAREELETLSKSLSGEEQKESDDAPAMPREEQPFIPTT